jgi:hypothetical protein
MPLLLGCARPPGLAKIEIDAYAALAGINGIAHPAEGVVELAARLGRKISVTPSCCSIAVGEAVMTAGEGGSRIELDLDQILEQERRHRASAVQAHARLRGIPVISRTGGGQA